MNEREVVRGPVDRRMRLSRQYVGDDGRYTDVEMWGRVRGLLDIEVTFRDEKGMYDGKTTGECYADGLGLLYGVMARDAGMISRAFSRGVVRRRANAVRVRGAAGRNGRTPGDRAHGR